MSPGQCASLSLSFTLGYRLSRLCKRLLRSVTGWDLDDTLCRKKRSRFCTCRQAVFVRHALGPGNTAGFWSARGALAAGFNERAWRVRLAYIMHEPPHRSSWTAV